MNGPSNSHWLVVSTPLKKYESIGMIIPNIWINKKCSEPPTRFWSLLYSYQWSTNSCRVLIAQFLVVFILGIYGFSKQFNFNVFFCVPPHRFLSPRTKGCSTSSLREQSRMQVLPTAEARRPMGFIIGKPWKTHWKMVVKWWLNGG